MDAQKYNSLVAWRSKASNVYQLTRETTNDPATYRVFVSGIDGNDAGFGEVENGYYLTDYMGTPYLIINFSTGYIDVEDSFRTGYCPMSNRDAYVHKSAYKGYSLFLPSFCFQFLHPLAASNNNKYSMSMLWANDPNPRRVLFVNIDSVLINDYTANVTDSDGIVFNPEEDYGQNPKFEVWQDNGDNTFSKLQTEPFVTRNIDGNIISVFLGLGGDTISGYYVISR